MKDDRFPREYASPKRPGARRRAAQAEVANYIHELSDRHAEVAPTAGPDAAATPDADADDA